ncbi:phage head closure protein [Heyndrickxia oleronia]|uniref:phage head closure protein n=1 Tax=Heyndrickxia oleronia TaxID=38875 RepID=UPI0020417905|nr:phage head closure protein [Heyndrickxia oleronia]MCM3454459.1 phage head closure protein [Heyndrickxia oleronia]
MKRINPADLNKRLTFQSPSRYQDGEGNWVEGGYKDAFTVWGSIKGTGSMRNVDVVVAGAMEVRSPKKIIIRINKNVKHNMRIVHKKDGRTFDVKDFDFAKDSKEFYEVICEEVGIHA